MGKLNCVEQSINTFTAKRSLVSSGLKSFDYFGALFRDHLDFLLVPEEVRQILNSHPWSSFGVVR